MYASQADARAIDPSAMIITALRLNRSTIAPENGPIRTWGRIATIVAVARTVADPVVLVSHQTSANWTSRLPISENCWRVQIVKNGPFQSSLTCAIPTPIVGSRSPRAAE